LAQKIRINTFQFFLLFFILMIRFYLRPKKNSSNNDELVKSQKVRFPVIPAKAGIQLFQILKNSLDSGFHRSDDFLRDHQ